MDNLNLTLFISFAGPLAIALFVCRGKARTLILFLLIGMVACLFCGELNTIIMNMLPYDQPVFARNFTPLIEEVCKALPILVYAFLYKPKRRMLLECSVLVGVGFAVQENAFVLVDMVDTAPLIFMMNRGFVGGIMHTLTTLAVGYGVSFVNTKRKLFYTGTAALLTTAIVYHSVCNTLMQSDHQLVCLLLPIVTFFIVLVLRKKRKRSEKLNKFNHTKEIVEGD